MTARSHGRPGETQLEAIRGIGSQAPLGRPAEQASPATRLEIPAAELARLGDRTTAAEFGEFGPADIADLRGAAEVDTSLEFAVPRRDASQASQVSLDERHTAPPDAPPAQPEPEPTPPVAPRSSGFRPAVVAQPVAAAPPPVQPGRGFAVLALQPAVVTAKAPAKVRPSTSLPPASGNIATHIFRKQALRAYEDGERLTTALRATPPSTWIAVLCILAALVSAVVVCALCSIDIIAIGPGILRSPGGARSVATGVGGTVERVAVSSGSFVEAGQVIAVIESSALQSELLQAKRRIEVVERKRARMASAGATLFNQNIELLKRDQALTRRRIRSQQQSIADLAAQGEAIKELSAEGIVSRSSEREAGERMREVDRNRLQLQQQLTQGEIGLTALERERARERDDLQAEYEAALAAREAIELRVARSTIVAPQSGRIESVVIKAGELVAEGAAIATLVPPQPPSQVIAFIPDRDRAFLAENARVRLELNQLPSGEFGTLTGRVTSVGSGFASVEEMRSVLTDVSRIQELSYRVDIRIDDDDKAHKILDTLRSGTLVTAHVVTRSRRIISLLFDPLRPYFE